MTSRRSGLSTARRAKDWPHQVAVRADLVAARHTELLEFCKDLAVAPRKQTVRRDDRDYVVFAFADPGHAESFRVQFDGESFDPRQRGRGVHWSQWRQE
jgi:hypothetical protein